MLRAFVVKLCAISVDLDEIPNYFQIHGLEAPERAKTAVYDVAVDRLARFASDAGRNAGSSTQGTSSLWSSPRH